jgi:Skp family chaperone for outer membrane proteins
MKKLILTALTASALLAPSAAFAQQRGGVLVVDTDRILAECTACKAATTQLQSQANTLRTRAQTLQQQIQTEGQPLQTAVNALNGKQPDAALKARIDAFDKRQNAARQELANGERNLQSIQANVQQQLGARLIQIVEQSRARRGASIAVAKNSTLASDTTVDITGEVLSALNQQLPAVSVTPLPQQPQQPSQGR